LNSTNAEFTCWTCCANSTHWVSSIRAYILRCVSHNCSCASGVWRTCKRNASCKWAVFSGSGACNTICACTFAKLIVVGSRQTWELCGPLRALRTEIALGTGSFHRVCTIAVRSRWADCASRCLSRKDSSNIRVGTCRAWIFSELTDILIV